MNLLTCSLHKSYFLCGWRDNLCSIGYLLSVSVDEVINVPLYDIVRGRLAVASETM